MPTKAKSFASIASSTVFVSPDSKLNFSKALNLLLGGAIDANKSEILSKFSNHG